MGLVEATDGEEVNHIVLDVISSFDEETAQDGFTGARTTGALAEVLLVTLELLLPVEAVGELIPE